MKFEIKDVKKAVEFIELIKFIKTLSNHITCMCSPEQMYIQLMDSSHVCLVDIIIPKSWFHSYDTQNVTFSMSANILSKICSMYTLDSVIEAYISDDDNDKIHFHLLHEQQNKLFAIPLMDIERDILATKDADTNLDFTIRTKLLEKYVGELSLFGEEVTIECRDDKIFFGANNDEGTFNIEIKNENLEEFNAIDDLVFKAAFSIKYLQYITTLSKIYPSIHLYLDDTNPLMITFDATEIKIKFFVAPKCPEE